MEYLLWIVGIIVFIILLAVGGQVISDIDYKRQLSGKKPQRDRVKESRRGNADTGANANTTMDSIEAQHYTESSVNNITGI